MERGPYFYDFTDVFIIIKLLGFVAKRNFSLLGSIHFAIKTLQQTTHCKCSAPFLSVTVKPKLRKLLSYFLVFFLAFFVCLH